MNKQKGYIALITVLIVMSVVITTTSTVAFLAIGEAQSGFSIFKGDETLTFVEGCAEDYLLKIRSLGASFVAGNITRPEGTCTIIVTSGNPNWDITVSTNATAYKRSIRVVFTRNATGIALTSWKEI